MENRIRTQQMYSLQAHHWQVKLTKIPHLKRSRYEETKHPHLRSFHGLRVPNTPHIQSVSSSPISYIKIQVGIGYAGCGFVKDTTLLQSGYNRGCKHRWQRLTISCLVLVLIFPCSTYLGQAKSPGHCLLTTYKHTTKSPVDYPSIQPVYNCWQSLV